MSLWKNNITLFGDTIQTSKSNILSRHLRHNGNRCMAGRTHIKIMTTVRTMAVVITTIITIILVVVTVSVIVVVDGFVIVVHIIPPPPQLQPPISLQTRWSPISASSLSMELKSFIPLSLSKNGRWEKRRKLRNLLLSKVSMTNNYDSDDDASPSTTMFTLESSTSAKEKYLQLAREAYIQYFSSSGNFNAQNQKQQQQQERIISLDEYLDLAMDAWNASNIEGGGGALRSSSSGSDSGRSDSGGKTVIPFLPIPNKNDAPTTSSSSTTSTTPSTSTEPSRQRQLIPYHFTSSFTTSNTTNFMDLHGSSESHGKQIEGQGNTDTASVIAASTPIHAKSDAVVSSAISIGGGVGGSRKTIDQTSMFHTFMKGWMGSALSMNASFLGREFSSGSDRSTSSNPVSAMISSIMAPFVKNNNNDDDDDDDDDDANSGMQNVDSMVRQLKIKQLQQPLTECQPPSTKKVEAAATETRSKNGMTNNVGERNIIEENKFVCNLKEEEDENDADNSAAMEALKKRPIDHDTLNEKGGERMDDGKDVDDNQNDENMPGLISSMNNGDKASVPSLPLKILPQPLKGPQQQQQRLLSLLQKIDKEEIERGKQIINSPEDVDHGSNASDDVAADILASEMVPGARASPSLTSSTASSLSKRSTRNTLQTSIPSVTAPLRGSFNVKSQGDLPKSMVEKNEAKVGEKKPLINVLKLGKQQETGSRSNVGTMTPSTNMLQEGECLQQALGLPFINQSANVLEGSAPPYISTKAGVNSRKRSERWDGSVDVTTNESFKSNRNIQWKNIVEGEMMVATDTDFMSDYGGGFNCISEDVTTSSSIGTVSPSGQGSELPPGLKSSIDDNIEPDWTKFFAWSLSSQNWARNDDNQKQELLLSSEFPSTSEFYQYGKSGDEISTDWLESYMGGDSDEVGDVNTAKEIKGTQDELWISTSMNDMQEPPYFPLLHIGSRIRSSVHGTTHEGYLFVSDDSSDGVIGKVRPCIAKRPWSVSELNATVPTKVLAFERGQLLDSLQDQQFTLESWELDAKAAAVRRYFEVEIHMFQKFEEKKKIFGTLRRQQLQEEDGLDLESEIVKRGDAVGIVSKAEVAVPSFLRVYPDDGSGGPNTNDAIAGYGKTGFDVWGKVLDPGHDWLVYEGRLDTEVTLSDAMTQGGMTDGIANRLCGVQRSLNLPETFAFGDVLDSVCRTLLEDLVFLSSCNVVHRDIRTVNILCDSEHHRLRLTNFGNAVDLDPPRVGLDNDRLVVDIPVSIANTLAADVFSVAVITCHLLFNVSEKTLSRQLKGVGYDLDLWLQQALAEDSKSEKFVNAFDYLQNRRGFWGFLKGAIRPNPLRKKITSDSLRQLDEILALKSGDMKWTDDRSKKIAQEEAFLLSVLKLPTNCSNVIFAVHPPEADTVETNEVTVPSPGAFDITRVPFTLPPRVKSKASILSELSMKIDRSALDALPPKEVPHSLVDCEYSDLTRIQFSPPRKSLLTDVLTSYSKQKGAVSSLQAKREALPEGKYFDITRAPFQRVSPQLQEKKALAIAVRFPDATPEDKLVSQTMEVQQIVAPPGMLGVVVDTPPKEKGPAYVSSISDDSPLLGQILLGDFIIAVDDLDVQTLVADEVSKILLTRSANVRRTISVLRKIENLKERQVDLGGELAMYEFDPESSIVQIQTLADSKHFDDVEKWILGILPHLQQDDVVYYCKCLISDGFDSLDMLEELVVEDLYFMKKAHRRVMYRRLSKQELPPEMIEEPIRTKKVYSVDEALGVAARKGIEATVAEEKRLAAEKVEKEKRKGAKPQKSDEAQLGRYFDDAAAA